jgi:hypothetical protein
MLVVRVRRMIIVVCGCVVRVFLSKSLFFGDGCDVGSWFIAGGLI